MPGTLPRLRTSGDLNEWRERLSLGLPNEEEIQQESPAGIFELVDSRTIRFRFDPGQSQVDYWEAQASVHPDFADPTESFTVYPPSRSVLYPIFDDPEQVCSRAVHFRVRPVKNNVRGEWGPRAVFRNPIPGAVHALAAFHFVDGPETENPYVNVNITLPRTATISGRTITDREGQFTDAVELESPVTELEGAIDDSQETITVPTGLGNRVKTGAYYKIDDEIILAGGRTDDVIDVLRGQFETTAAAHDDESVVLFYAKILRDQFSADNSGLYGVTVTIPNDEKVRIWDFVARPLSRCGKPGPETALQLDLPPPALIVDLTAGAFFQLIELRWSELPWTAYRYEIYHATTGTVQIADLDPTTTGDTEFLARPLADHEGEAVFQYPIKYDGTLHYFGVRAVDILGGYNLPTGGDTVGPVVPDQSEEDAADDVTDFTASEGPATSPAGRPPRARGASGSVVTTGFTPPAAAPPWARAKIYLQPIEAQATLNGGIDDSQTDMLITLSEFPRLAGWQFFQIDTEVVKVTAFDFTTGEATITRGEFGTTPAAHLDNANIFPYTKPVPVNAEGAEAPLVFHWPSIGNVALYCVSVAAGGTENAVLSSPTLNINLDGQVSPPLEVQNLHAVKTVYGILFVWSDGLEPDLDHYDVADLGSRTLVLQADPDDDQIVSRIPASPGDSRRVTYEHAEILFEGTIAQGSSTVVLAGDSEVSPDRYKPLGATPVKETLRIVVSDGADALSHDDYEIDSNTANTIVLADAPTEASSGNIAVKFYIGQRIHKVYVRAVNRSDLASEWRPVETTFLEPTATAPDGTVDLGVPHIQVSPETAGSHYLTGRTELPGDGTVTIFPSADGDADKRNISGIVAWVVRITYTDLTTGATGIVETFEAATNSKEAPIDVGDRGHFTELPGPIFVYLGESFDIMLPNAEIEMVELAAKNYFGLSSFREILYQNLTAGPYYTGNKPDDVMAELAPSSPVVVDLGNMDGAFINMVDDVTEITVLGARAGRWFTLVFLQGATPRGVDWSANAAFKVTNSPGLPLRLANHYTSMTFMCRTATEFFMIGAPVNGPYTAP
jgi:hypothetical protein